MCGFSSPFSRGRRETGSMNQAPTLGKIRKYIEKDGHDSSCPYIKERKEGTRDGFDESNPYSKMRDDPLFHGYVISVMVE